MKQKINIPLVDLASEHKAIAGSIAVQLKDCFKEQAWILGPKEVAFEGQFADYLNIKHVVGVANGTDALIMALRALAIKTKGKEYFDKKDEIITTPFTFIATSEAIIHAGATPVMVDIDKTYNIDPLQVKKAVTKNTIGILPVHLYGLPADMPAIMAIAKKHKLFVVEDVAQACGSAAGTKKTGTFGDCGCFSFFPTKNLGCYGDGGAVTTNDDELNRILRVLRNHGQTATYNADHIGYNSRLDSLQAAILSVKLKQLDKLNGRRRAVAAGYDKALAGIKGLGLPIEPKGAWHVYNLYTIKVERNRDQVVKALNAQGIAARIYYPYLICHMKAYKKAKICGDLKNSQSAAAGVLSLPSHPFISKSQIAYAARILGQILTN